MAKPRVLGKEEVQANPLLADLLVRAKVSGESVITYEGATFVVQQVEDITHTFTPSELAEFAKAYAEVDDPKNRLTGDQMLRLIDRELENG